MSSTKDFAEYVTSDLFREIPGVTARAMFGGYGLYKDGIVFGIIVENVVYLKVNDSNKPEYEKRGSNPFIYEMKNKKIASMPYYELPEDIMENTDALREWVEKSVEISKTSKKAKA